MTPSRRGINAVLIATGAVLLLVVSLAVYSRSTEGMRGDGRGFYVKRYVMGLPTWLELSIVRLEPGTSLDFARSFAQATKIPLAWHVRPWSLAVSLGACLLLSAIAVGLQRACFDRAPEKHLGRLAWGLGIGVIPALVVGAFVPTRPEWIGVYLVLVALPLCVVCASAIMRDYLRGVAVGFLVAVALMWSQRLTDVFGVPDGIQTPDADWRLLVEVIVMGSCYASVALVSTLAARLLQSRTRHAEPLYGL